MHYKVEPEKLVEGDSYLLYRGDDFIGECLIHSKVDFFGDVYILMDNKISSIHAESYRFEKSYEFSDYIECFILVCLIVSFVSLSLAFFSKGDMIAVVLFNILTVYMTVTLITKLSINSFNVLKIFKND